MTRHAHGETCAEIDRALLTAERNELAARGELERAERERDEARAHFGRMGGQIGHLQKTQREHLGRIERAERVVEAARALVDDELSETGDCMVSCDAQREDGAHDPTCSLANARNALEMYDQTTRADTVGELPPLPTFEPATVEGIADLIRGDVQHVRGLKAEEEKK